jgi:hypothetical protein
MASYNSLSSDAAANYGTDANYQANYRLTQALWTPTRRRS